MVGVNNDEDTDNCTKEINTPYYTRQCADGGICFVGPVGDIPVVQQCVYKLIFTGRFNNQNGNLCDLHNTMLCCSEDYCNSRDNYTKFLARRTSTVSSTASTTGTTIVMPTASISGELFYRYCYTLSNVYGYSVNG